MVAVLEISEIVEQTDWSERLRRRSVGAFAKRIPESPMSLCRTLPLWFVAWTVGGLLVGKFVLHDTLKGATWGFVIGSIPIWIMLMLGIWVSLVARDHPRCRCGRWRSGDFESLEYCLDQPMFFDYRCHGCGRKYRHREGVCYEVDVDGQETPYMTHKGLLPWRPVSKA